MLCRRCMSNRLLRLAVMHPADNPVLRCLEVRFPVQSRRTDRQSRRGLTGAGPVSGTRRGPTLVRVGQSRSLNLHDGPGNEC